MRVVEIEDFVSRGGLHYMTGRFLQPSAVPRHQCGSALVKKLLFEEKTVIHSSAFANLNICACDNYFGQMG